MANFRRLTGLLRGDYQKVEIFEILGPHSHPAVEIEIKFCTAKRTHVPVGPPKFDVNRCNESPLRGEKPDLWPVSKFNTDSLPLGGILPVTTRNKSITSKAMAVAMAMARLYRQDIVTRMPTTPVELITISIVTIGSICHNSAADFLSFGKLP